MILANPQFGKKCSVTITSDEGDVSRETLTIHREDFWATTSSKLADKHERMSDCRKD